jgi:hypothetical protein
MRLYTWQPEHSMRLSTETVRQMRLPLLVVFIFCASIANLATGQKSHPLVIELEAEGDPHSPAGGVRVAGIKPDVIPRGFYSYALVHSTRLSTVAGSDAYPSIILHGPPVPGYII